MGEGVKGGKRGKITLVSEKRKAYEFSERTKESARRKWHRDNPGNEHVQLEVHHKTPIKYARENGIPPAVIRQDNNAVAMPVQEHKKVNHRDEEQINAHLSTLAMFVGKLI